MKASPLSRIYVSLGLFSAGGLALEIGLTRLLATLYYPPLIFAVLSLAVLGIGTGAALATYFPALRIPARIPVWMASAGVCALLLVPGALILSANDLLPVLIALLILPYTFIGLGVTAIFSADSERSRLLYAFDLAGAGLGALLVIPLLNLLGAVDGLLVIGTLLIGAALVYGAPKSVWGALAGGVVVFASSIITGWSTLDMGLAAEKPIHEALNGGRLLETRWDAFARTDIVQPPDGGPYRIYVDGAAASVMPTEAAASFLMRDIGLFAFATAQPERVFSIGSGGGLDVWFGLRVGASTITAVEVNPQSVILTREYGVYNGDIYDQPGVRVLVDEGRSVLRREDDTYDLIFLSQVVTLSAERSGYALTENTVFTIEAFSEYWDHLTDEGYLGLKLYDEPTLSRSLSLVLAVLNQRGVNDADGMRHVIALLDPSTSPPTPLLMARKTPFTMDESASIGRAAQQLGFVPLFLPGLHADPPLDVVASGEVSFAQIVAESSIDLSPPTDDRPFFYQFEHGLPGDLLPLVILMIAVIVIGVVGLVMIYRRVRPPAFPSVVVYFAMLGMGFMLVEIAFIQFTGLFIGHPITSVTTVLAALLISGGLGSAWYHRRRLDRLSWRPVALAGIASLIWLGIWSLLASSLLGLPLAARIAVVIITIAPVGVLMGIPFAAGLQQVGRMYPNYVPLAWSINGVMTVAGTVAAVSIALVIGYSAVLILGAVGYGIGALAAYRIGAAV